MSASLTSDLSWPRHTPGQFSAQAPPLGCVCCHVKAMWIHTSNKVWPTPRLTHTPYVGRQPVTPDISAVEVRPRADWPAVEVPQCARERCAGGQEYQYSAIKTTEQWQKHKGSSWTQWAHSAQTLLQKGKLWLTLHSKRLFSNSKKFCNLSCV